MLRFRPRDGTVLSDEQIKELRQKREAGVLIKDLMKEFKLSKASVYRYLETANQ